MNILRKLMSKEARDLKPVLDRVYNAILAYQENRTPDHERLLRQAVEPAVDFLMVFHPYMPSYKREYFDMLKEEWPDLPARELIMLFDHCIAIMHLRLSREKPVGETHKAWTRRLTDILEERRLAERVRPMPGGYLTSGLPASQGRAQGRALVVAKVAPGLDLGGRILVCPMSSPDWVPYLGSVRGLVTDQGGIVCHATILAREMNLPCVVGCGNATVAIKSGDLIEIDGDFGLVTRLSPAPGEHDQH